MQEFRWNGGGTFRGKDWDEHLATDSAVSPDQLPGEDLPNLQTEWSRVRLLVRGPCVRAV